MTDATPVLARSSIYTSQITSSSAKKDALPRDTDSYLIFRTDPDNRLALQ